MAIKLRPGNAGANTIADHIEVLAAAIAQIPPKRRRRILITCDGAGATIELLQFITTLNTRSRRAHYSVGFDLDERARTAIAALPKDGWTCVLDDAGQARDPKEAGTAELTGLLRHSAGGDKLATWPGRTIKIPHTWPWAHQLQRAIASILALPAPT